MSSEFLTTKQIIEKYNVRPQKYMGQNFLWDLNIVKKIVQSADISKKDIIVEVGPGLGIITQGLVKKAKKVIAVEKDRAMVEILNDLFKGYNNIEIIKEDILELIENKKLPKNYSVVANIPYYLTSNLIRKLLECKTPPNQMTLIIQKEVAQRICEKKNLNLLAISVQIYAKPEIISYISKNSFWPKPKVDSAIIKISDIKKQKPNKYFFKIVKAGFSHPRKQIVNNLAEQLNFDKNTLKQWLIKNNIDYRQRPETLSLKDWIGLSKNFENIV